MQNDNQEVDLKKGIKIVLKRKWVVIAILLVCLIPASTKVFIDSFTQKYNVSLIVQNGFFNGWIIEKKEALEIIKSDDILKKVIDNLQLDITVADLRKDIVVSDVKDTSFTKIKITVKKDRINIAEGICKEIANNYISYANECYSYVREYTEMLDRMGKEQLPILLQKVEELENIRSELPKEETDEDKIRRERMDIQIHTCRSEILNCLALINQISLRLSQHKEFRIINLNVSPIKKGKMIIVGAMLFGLILGFFIAFFVEYWKGTS